ncbi:peptide-binding protein [Candidatus Bathyarchaeota archaeon]|nr:peptide-binding protein [Candidatus Bathyarchaeota archaeon]MBL7080101.1 peptide-binding protein [Candidatus Bathyarchaeota archaeon]
MSPAQTIKGPATDVIEYVRVDRPLAPEALRQGDIDVYIFSIPSEAEIEIGDDDEDIAFYRGVSGMNDILLNPAPAPEGQLNPFSIKEVRYAMNFIFDRDFIVNEIYQGTAAQMYDYLGPFHPEVPSIADIKLSHGFVYDFDRANSMVEDAMVLAGAEKRAGKWYYKDEAVTIKALIRVEDERRDMGDAFAADVEKLGFTIEYLHSTFGPAIDIVYGTDPAAFEWGFYTEGWGIGASRWNTWEPGCWGGSADPELGDWCANMPGWAEEGWWNYISPGARIDILTTDIYYGRYDDLADREEKMREATDLMMDESIRIFGIRELTAYPARTDVEGLTQDMGQGLRGAVWAPREAYREGSTTLTFGNLWVWTETTVWNMFGGFNDVYSVDIARSTYDPTVWRHPFTASAQPFRADYEVETEGPLGTMDVPSDAYTWDAEADEWVEVGSGVESTSKVSFDLSKYTSAKWHNDIPISMADILYAYASGWDITDDADKSAKESAVASGAGGYYTTVKGIVVPDEDTLEIYLDFYHFDDNEIAIFAQPWGGFSGIGHNPWELMAAQEDVVFEKGLLAMDQAAADVYGVPWMSLVLSDHAEIVKDSLVELLAAEYFPSGYFTLGDTTYDTLDNALARYQASIDWYDDKGILWIGNGPFTLEQFDAEAQYAKTVAYRDESYPFSPGDWYYGRPAVPEVVDVTVPTVTKGIAATIDIEMTGPETLAATYIITEEATGALVLKGEADITATYGMLKVPLTTEDTDLLDIGGRYVLTILGKSPDVAFLSEATERFVVRDPLIVGLGETVDELTGEIDELSDSLSELSSDLADSLDALSGLIGAGTGAIAEDIDDLSSDIRTVTQAVSDTNDSISQLASSSSTLLYAVVATLLVALLGVATPYLKKS